MSGYILWHQDNSGESQFWFMDKEMISRRATALFENSAPALVGPPFRIVGTHRGNILWHNDQSHETQFWFMNNERIVQRATAVDETGAKIFIAPPFHIVGFADFNGDNNSDILWFNDVSHETQIWFMNRERIVRRETVIDEKGAKIFIGPPFRIVGGADFDGNGNADILWYNSESGETQIWFMNKHQIVRRGTALFENKSAALIHPPFRIVGTADTDMNGKSEIIWHQDVSHDTVLWFMDGEQIVRRPAVIDEHGKVIDIAPPFHVVGGGATAVDPLLATKLIREKYTALGGARSRLGLPVDQSFRALDLPVATGSNSGGFQAQFRSGVITLSNDPAPVLTGVVQDEAQIFLVAIECQIKEEKVDEIYGSVGAIKTSSQESKVTHFPADGDPFEMGAEGQRVVSLQTPVYTARSQTSVLSALWLSTTLAISQSTKPK
jgi:hypothetical protein